MNKVVPCRAITHPEWSRFMTLMNISRPRAIRVIARRAEEVFFHPIALSKTGSETSPPVARDILFPLFCFVLITSRFALWGYVIAIFGLRVGVIHDHQWCHPHGDADRGGGRAGDRQLAASGDGHLPRQVWRTNPVKNRIGTKSGEAFF